MLMGFYFMNTILGIKFREYGQIYYFLAGQCAPSIGDRVIVETEQGQGIGEVVLLRETLPSSVLPQLSKDASSTADLSLSSDAAVNDAAPALLITNAITSAVVIPNSDLTVADIPYASAVVTKMQALKQDQQRCDASTEAMDNATEQSTLDFAEYELTPISDDFVQSDETQYDYDSDQDDTAKHNCCGHGDCGQQDSALERSSELRQENLDGGVVASSEIESINAPLEGESLLYGHLQDNQFIEQNIGMSERSEDASLAQESSAQNPVYSGRMVSYDGSAGEHSSDNQPPEDTSQPLSFDDLRPILRVATEYDLEHAMSNELLSREASNYCKECIKARELDMKLVDVEVFFDLSKFIFYFTAPARIDFRELVKDLVKHYRTRIELRQIGVRHETQMIGAVGNCGMVCCCRRFLRKFAPVTIKMAKEQNLFLNPAKISGICGRLLCCLSYEQENYEEFHRRCPRLGKKYMTSKGPIKVMRANMFRNSLIAYSETGEELEIPLEEWQDMEVRRSDSSQQSTRTSRRDKTNGAPEKGAVPTEKVAQASDQASGKQDITKKPVLSCTGACERCGECGPNTGPTKRPLPVAVGESNGAEKLSEPFVAPNASADPEQGSLVVQESANAERTASPAIEQSRSTKQDTVKPSLSPHPIQANVHDAEQVMASLSGVHLGPSAVSEHGIPTTQARQAALVQSLAGMDGGPLCSIAQPDKPVTPAAIADHVLADVASAGEVAAKQAPASIAMPERLIKSTDTSALKTSRGRRKRRRKPREGASGGSITDSFEQGDSDFNDNDMD